MIKPIYTATHLFLYQNKKKHINFFLIFYGKCTLSIYLKSKRLCIPTVESHVIRRNFTIKWSKANLTKHVIDQNEMRSFLPLCCTTTLNRQGDATFSKRIIHKSNHFSIKQIISFQFKIYIFFAKNIKIFK